MSQKKVIFLDSVHPILFDRLNQAGFNCEWHSQSKREELPAILTKAEGIVIRSRFLVNQEIVSLAPNLKWIARSGAGMENINLSLAKDLGIKCYNSPEGNKDAVAEHATGMLLSLFNNLTKGDMEVRQGIWDREGNRGLELKGKTVGILGYGNMGQAFSERLIGFGVNTIAYDKYKTGFSSQFVREVKMEELFETTDILSIHLPFTEETRFLVDLDFIRKFKKPIFIINTARGKHLKIKDLIAALNDNKVKGACLDVLEFETSSFEQLDSEEQNKSLKELLNDKRVILSPHVAGWTVESYEKLASVLADKILANHSPQT